jgi:hypothetical protein
MKEYLPRRGKILVAPDVIRGINEYNVFRTPERFNIVE